MNWQQTIKKVDVGLPRDEQGSPFDDRDFSRDLDQLKPKWHKYKEEIDEAYTTLWNNASKKRYGKSYWHSPTRPEPFGSPAHFFHFLNRFFSTKRYDRPAMTGEFFGGRQRYHRERVSTFPSEEFNRRWRTWDDLRSWSQNEIVEKLNPLFRKLGWFDLNVVRETGYKSEDKRRGTGYTMPGVPYSFSVINFKEWRELDKLLSSGKKIPIKYRGIEYLESERK